MTNYTKITNFATKDSLTPGDANKKVKGTEIDNEFNAIVTAVATKADLASPALTGTPTAPTAAADTNTTQIATTAYVQTEIAASEAASKRIISYAQTVKASDTTLNTLSKTDMSMDLAITPASDTNKILILLQVEVLHRQNGDDSGVEIGLYVDDVLEKEVQHQFAASSNSVTNAGLGGTVTIIHLDSPATTNEVTYSVKANSMFVGGDGSTFYGGLSTITALELEA